SNIFGTDEPAQTRSVSNKNKSNVFASTNDDEQAKRQQGVRQGLRGKLKNQIIEDENESSMTMTIRIYLLLR
ncbi:unnamed protein product, partial [Rotaria magnacalcarata]